MQGVLGDIVAGAIGMAFPYALFIGFRSPLNLRLDTSDAGSFEKLSYRWLKRVLFLSGAVGAGATYADRHSDDGLVFGLLLAATFAIWMLTVPAGALAFRRNYGWVTKPSKRRR